jgi:hypothetical protein
MTERDKGPLERGRITWRRTDGQKWLPWLFSRGCSWFAGKKKREEEEGSHRVGIAGIEMRRNKEKLEVNGRGGKRDAGLVMGGG